MRRPPLRTRPAVAGLALALGAVAPLLAACGTSSAAGAPTATTSPATTALTTPAAPGATVGGATAITSTTAGSRPPGVNGPYPWQPAPRYDSDGSPSPSWLAAAADLRTQAQRNPATQVVFLGDSITQGWLNVGAAAWNAEWLPRKAIAEGIIGDTTQNLLWRIDNGALTGVHPKAVVLLIGTNDYGAGWSAAQVAQGIEACAAAVRAALPDAALVLLNVFPRTDAGGPIAQKVKGTNAALAAAALPAGTTLVDMTPTMAGPGGAPNPALFGPDLLHPSAEGYDMIAGRLLAVPVLADLPATG